MWEICRSFKLIIDNQEKGVGMEREGGGLLDNKPYNSKMSPCLEFHSYVFSGTSKVL